MCVCVNILEGKLPPPIGPSDWATFSQDSSCVDKTLLVTELVQTYPHDLKETFAQLKINDALYRGRGMSTRVDTGIVT